MIWILMLFVVGVLGALGFYDTIFVLENELKVINSGILVSLSIGLLLRAIIKIRLQKNERLEFRSNRLLKKNAELQDQVRKLTELIEQKYDKEPVEYSK
jgi:hypothetical protein